MEGGESKLPELSPEDSKLLAQSVAKIANTYSQLNIKEKKRQRFWTHKHFGTYLLITAALFGYWLNWRSDIVDARVTRIETKVKIKQIDQKLINKAATVPRVLVDNQIVLCGETHKTQPEMKTERNNSLVDLIATTTGTRFTYNPSVQNKLNEIIQSINNIDDVCKLNGHTFDLNQRNLFVELTNLINASIEEDEQKLRKLTSQQHYIQSIALI